MYPALTSMIPMGESESERYHLRLLPPLRLRKMISDDRSTITIVAAAANPTVLQLNSFPPVEAIEPPDSE
jgi:hypothetical protein